MSEEPKILKVTMEFEDRVQVIEGEEAERWLNACNNQSVMEHIHGRSFPNIAWRVTCKESDK